MKKILAIALIAGMFMPLVSGAQEKGKKSPEEQFKRMDTNSDGKLSKDEYLANVTDEKKKENRGRQFDRWDKDSDKHLSLDEFKAGLEMQKNKN